MLRGFVIGFGVLCVVLCSVMSASATTYNLVALPPVGANTQSIAYSVSYVGGSPTAVGYSLISGNASNAPTLWNSAGVATNLLTSIGNGATAGSGNMARYIDAAGDVVGQTLVSGVNRGFYLPYGGSGTVLPAFSGSNYPTVLGCNGLGMVVGSATGSDGFLHAILWSASTGYVDLGTGTGGQVNYATAISPDGNTIVGDYNASGVGQQGQACKWTKSGSTWTLTTLVPLSTYNQSVCEAINSSGDICGSHFNYASGGFPSTSMYGLYLPHGDGIVSLGSPFGNTYNYAWGINDSGVMVGQDGTLGPAWVDYNGTPAGQTNLTTLLAPGQGTGWTLQVAYGIDNHGDIALRAKNAGALYEGALLVPVPVPEPSTLVLMVGGLFGLIAYAWRKRK